MTDLVKRIHKAVIFIEDHLDDDFSLTEASAIACYSHYHFLRTFLSLTGLTVGVYIRRRRLTKAADNLISTDRRIIDIALDAGFESQATFSRAFKSMFSKAPAAFRREGTKSPFRGQPVITEAYINHLKIGAVTMKPRFTHKDKFVVIGMGQDAPAGTNMGDLWDKFLPQKHKIERVCGKEAYGICYAAKEKDAHPDHFHYTAALPVHDDSSIPEGMEKIVIERHEYAVFTHRGPVSNISETNDYIWKTWLPQSGYEPAHSPDFELYDERFKADDADSEFDIYVPIKR